jgi:hypothetical protein
MLMQDPRRANLVVSAFLINELKVRSGGLDLFLSNTPEHPAVIDLYYFTRMITFVVSNPGAGDSFCTAFERSRFGNYCCESVTEFPSLAKVTRFSCPHQLHLINILKFLLPHSRPSQFLFPNSGWA